MNMDKLEKKIAVLREIIVQYIYDMKMWQTAHGVEYPQRRVKEIMEKLEEIDKI